TTKDRPSYPTDPWGRGSFVAGIRVARSCCCLRGRNGTCRRQHFPIRLVFRICRPSLRGSKHRSRTCLKSQATGNGETVNIWGYHRKPWRSLSCTALLPVSPRQCKFLTALPRTSCTLTSPLTTH